MQPFIPCMINNYKNPKCMTTLTYARYFPKKAPSNLFASSGCLNFTLLTKAPAPSSPILHLHPDLSTVYDILRKIPSTLSSLFRSMKVSGHVAGCPRCTVQLQSLLLWRTGATEGYGKKKKKGE